jgi:hypothetical protein
MVASSDAHYRWRPTSREGKATKVLETFAACGLALLFLKQSSDAFLYNLKSGGKVDLLSQQPD